ncbi:MAG: DUF3617 family protein [Candidatus Parcubacteria bacterium]|nr:DUF3617 family protein [Burkholderiales bacterium]
MRIFLLILGAAFVNAAGAELGEGNWDLEIATVIGGKAGPAMKQSRCVKSEDIQNVAKLIGGAGAGCEFTNRQFDGATFRFDLSCAAAPVPMSGSGEVRYSTDVLDGQIQIRVGSATPPMELRSNLKARRTGPCR